MGTMIGAGVLWWAGYMFGRSVERHRGFQERTRWQRAVMAPQRHLMSRHTWN